MFKAESRPSYVKKKDVYHLYWISSDHHTDITKEGYIGISGDVNSRWSSHKNAYSNYKTTGNTHHHVLHKAADKYKGDLNFTILVEGSGDYIFMLEELLRPASYIGWNINSGGEIGWKGRTHSEYTKKKISESKIGYSQSEETKNKRAKSLTGLKRSDEARSNISKAISSYYLNETDDQRAYRIIKQSEARRGWKYSSEAKLSMSKAAILSGIKPSQKCYDAGKEARELLKQTLGDKACTRHSKHKYIYTYDGICYLSATTASLDIGVNSPQSFRFRCKSCKYPQYKVYEKGSKEYLYFLYIYDKQERDKTI